MGMLRIVQREAEANGVKRVLSVRLRLGDFSDVLPAYLESCFALAARGTVAEGARLQFVRAPARVYCRDCAAEAQIDKRRIACPVCGGDHLRLLSGTECRVESMEAE